MAYPAYRSERRYKRRRWLTIALSLVVIVVLIALVVSRQTDQRETAEFLGAAEAASALNDEASQTFGETIASIGFITRQDLTRRLESVTEKATEADELLDVGAPSVIGVSYGTMRTASASWAEGAKETFRVVLGIMDGEIVDTAVPELQRALDQLSVGDVAYEQFLSSLVTVAQETEIPDFPMVRYIGEDPSDPLRYSATNLVVRIRTAYSLSPRRDVSVTGMTDPEAVGDRGGIPLVPLSESIAVTALITNEGNEDEATVGVVLDLLNVDTGEIISRPDVVIDLVAGASTTVRFENLEIEPGGLYQAKVTVTISDDIDLENDVWDLTFIWNAES